MLLPLVCGWGASSCSLFPEPEPTLPPVTQTGANTFGCLINGKVFVPKDGIEPKIVKNYQGNLSIVASCTEDNLIKQLSIGTGIITQTGTYSGENYFGMYFADQKTACFTGLNNSTINGKLVITKFERGEDKVNNLKWLIISGTFEGDLVPEKKCTDTIRITRGRFDVKFN